MKEQNFLPVSEAAEYLNLSLNTIYSEITRKRRAGKNYLFKKDGHFTLVDVNNFKNNDKNADEAARKIVEDLYFKALQKFGNDYAIAVKLSPVIGIGVRAVYMRLREFTFTTKRVTNQMKFALETILKASNEN